MKHKILLVLFLSFMTCFTVSAQKVTMQFRQVKLAKVFDAITQQTGLTVAYSVLLSIRTGLLVLKPMMKSFPAYLVNCSQVQMWLLKLVRKKSI